MLSKIFSQRKNKSNALHMNISLNLDGPFSLRDRESSFLSYHTQEGHLSSHNEIDYGQSERDIEYMNQNFTAIFNNPIEKVEIYSIRHLSLMRYFLTYKNSFIAIKCRKLICRSTQMRNSMATS